MLAEVSVSCTRFFYSLANKKHEATNFLKEEMKLKATLLVGKSGLKEPGVQTIFVLVMNMREREEG